MRLPRLLIRAEAHTSKAYLIVGFYYIQDRRMQRTIVSRDMKIEELPWQGGKGKG